MPALQPPCERHSAGAPPRASPASSIANAPTRSGCRIERGVFLEAERLRARGARAGASRAPCARTRCPRARRRRFRGELLSRSPSQSGRGDWPKAPISPPRGARRRSISAAAPAPARRSGASAETVSASMTPGRVWNRPRRRAALPRREASMRATSSPSHAGTGVARGERGASIRRRAAAGRRSISIAYAAVSAEGVAWRRASRASSSVVPVLSRNRTVGSREAGVSVKARKGEKSKVAATTREPKRSL